MEQPEPQTLKTGKPNGHTTASRRRGLDVPAGLTAILFATLLGIASGYFSAAGWVIANLDNEVSEKTDESGKKSGEVVYQGISFSSIYDARAAIDKDQITSLFKWTYNLPASLPLFITALSFGILGGIANVIYKAIGGEVQTNQRVVLKPLFGGLIGLMVLGMTYVLPAVLTVDNSKVRPVSLAFLSMYAGAFSTHVYLWLEEKIKTLFALDKKEDSNAPPEEPKPEPAK
jgi:hypothetical protein